MAYRSAGVPPPASSRSLWNQVAKIWMSASIITRPGPTNSSSAAVISPPDAFDDQSWMRRPTASSNRASRMACSSSARQQRLYLRPLPHVHGAFLEIDRPSMRAQRNRGAGRDAVDGGAYPLVVAIDASKLRHGRVRGRYFRENFAQAGTDLSQIIPQLVTNADAAIDAAGRERGRIQLRLGPADPEFLQAWKTALRSLQLPALRGWRYELVCSDDGEGVDADVVDQRLGALGVVPEHEGQRGLFGRGLRDVWLAQGGGRIQGVRDGRAVESWFLPADGDDPYVYTHVLDASVTPAIRREFGIAHEGTRVTVPLADGHLPPNARLRRLIADLVQLRPILEDESRELLLELPDEPHQLVRYAAPEPDPERPVLFDDEVELQRGVTARVVV